MFFHYFTAYIQTTRALMITGSILGLPGLGMLLMSMPCISLGNEPQSSKNKRTILGGVLVLIVGKYLAYILPLIPNVRQNKSEQDTECDTFLILTC